MVREIVFTTIMGSVSLVVGVQSSGMRVNSKEVFRMDLWKKRETMCRISELVSSLNPGVVKRRKIRKNRPHCVLRINEHGSLVMQGWYKSRVVNVLIPANGSIRNQLLQLPDSTWGHAHEIVQKFVIPNLDKIEKHLKIFKEYKLF